MNNSVASAFRTYVSQKHGSVCAGASAQELERLESNLKITLPEGVRLLYLESDGTSYDKNMERFLPLGEIYVDEDQGGLVVIFERSIFAETWGFQKTENLNSSAILSSGFVKVADSLEEFLRQISA